MHLFVFFAFWFFLMLLFKVRFALGFTGMGETALLLVGVIGAESICLLKGVEVVRLLGLVLAGVLGSKFVGLLRGADVMSLMLVEVLAFVVLVRSLRGADVVWWFDFL